jgi:RNA 2',3'-cyclic 3'-phosphodiesterase
MDAIRSFIAIELPAEVRQRLNEIIVQMQERCLHTGGEAARKAVRWVPADNIHLTLKFLGEVSVSNLQELARMLKVETSHYIPFTIQVKGIGAFPNIRRPRVIWVGSEAPPALAALQQAIETETRALGYPTEDREFSPHLTIGRVSQNASPVEISAISKALTGYETSPMGEIMVDQVQLFRSDLRPTGAIYTSLYEFRLGKTVNQV